MKLEITKNFQINYYTPKKIFIKGGELTLIQDKKPDQYINLTKIDSLVIYDERT